MSLGSLFKRIHLVNLDLELAVLDNRVEFVDVEFEFLARFDICEQLRTSHFDALRRQFPRTTLSV